MSNKRFWMEKVQWIIESNGFVIHKKLEGKRREKKVTNKSTKNPIREKSWFSAIPLNVNKRREKKLHLARQSMKPLPNVHTRSHRPCKIKLIGSPNSLEDGERDWTNKEKFYATSIEYHWYSRANFIFGIFRLTSQLHSKFYLRFFLVKWSPFVLCYVICDSCKNEIAQFDADICFDVSIFWFDHLFCFFCLVSR